MAGIINAIVGWAEYWPDIAKAVAEFRLFG